MTRATSNEQPATRKPRTSLGEEHMTTLLRAVIDASGLSRRKAFAAIREGRVTVAGEARTEPSSEYGGGTIELDGRALGAPAEVKTYLLLNKPPGVISTASDERRRRTVLDLVPGEMRAPGLHPVGRLDRDTSGLLLLTNDGDLTFRLTHPKHEVEKEYWLRLAEPVSDAQLAALRRGVELDGSLRAPLRVRLLQDAASFQLSITIGEGRNRQVRRMFEAVGAKVTQLRRVREGDLALGALPEGAVRALTGEEVERVRDGDKGQMTKDKGKGTGDRGQGTGDGGQGTKDIGHRHRHRHRKLLYRMPECPNAGEAG